MSDLTLDVVLLRDLSRFLWYVAANAPGDARDVARDLANRLPDEPEDDEDFDEAPCGGDPWLMRALEIIDEANEWEGLR